MPLLQLVPGSTVSFRDQSWRIVATFSTDRACLASVDGHKKIMAPIAELQPSLPPNKQSSQQLLTFEDTPERAEAVKWMECIYPLRNLADRTKGAIQKRAAEYKIHPATLYRRLAVWDRHGSLDALLPRKPDGGRGKSRLRPDVQELIKTSIESHYLNKQRLTIKDVAMEVRRAANSLGCRRPI